MSGYFEDSEERQRRISAGGKQDGGETAGENPAADNPKLVVGARSWQEAIDQQNAASNAQREAAFDKQLAGYQQLEDADRQQKAAIQQNRGTALLAMMNSIRQNGGTMNPALNQAVSEALGFPVTGAFIVNKGKMAGTVIVGTAQKDANGQLKNGIGMMVSPEQRYQVFSRLNTRQAIPYMMADYAAIKQQSGLTDQQLARRGFTNPVGPTVVGATTDGKATSRLFGITAKPKPRSGFSWFASDGKGGITEGVSNADTGFLPAEVNKGTRADDYQGRWKLRSTGPSDTFDGKGDRSQVRIYENDKTGEVVRVKDGEIPPWERRENNKKSGLTAQERLAELELKEKGNNERQDKKLAVQMQRADTYGKRVALIEQKLKNDYEVAMKRATTDEERQKVDAEYKDRMASVSEGNLDLGWFKAETSADQNQQKIDNEKVYRDRLLALKARKIALEKEGKQLPKSELDEMLKLQKVLEGSGLEPETRQLVHDQLNDIMEPKPSATSGGDNVDYDKSQSTEYPRYTNGKAKRAIAAGWTWNAETKRFEPPKGK